MRSWFGTVSAKRTNEVGSMCYSQTKHETLQSNTTMFTEWHSTMLHVSISKESSSGNSYNTFRHTNSTSFCTILQWGSLKVLCKTLEA